MQQWVIYFLLLAFLRLPIACVPLNVDLNDDTTPLPICRTPSEIMPNFYALLATDELAGLEVIMETEVVPSRTLNRLIDSLIKLTRLFPKADLDRLSDLSGDFDPTELLDLLDFFIAQLQTSSDYRLFFGALFQVAQNCQSQDLARIFKATLLFPYLSDLLKALQDLMTDPGWGETLQKLDYMGESGKNGFKILADKLITNMSLEGFSFQEDIIDILNQQALFTAEIWEKIKTLLNWVNQFLLFLEAVFDDPGIISRLCQQIIATPDRGSFYSLLFDYLVQKPQAISLTLERALEFFKAEGPGFVLLDDLSDILLVDPNLIQPVLMFGAIVLSEKNVEVALPIVKKILLADAIQEGFALIQQIYQGCD